MTKTGLESLLHTLKKQSQKSSNLDVADGEYCLLPVSWLKHDHKSVYPIETEQIISLKAMVAYVSHKTGIAEYRIEREFADHFSIPNMKCLPKEMYDQALRFVCDKKFAA